MTKGPLREIPDALADVALIDGPTAAAAASVCISQWHNLVRTGVAPQPAIRGTRYTRWRMADVRKFLIERRADASLEEALRAKLGKATAKSATPEARAKCVAVRARNKADRQARLRAGEGV